MSQESSFSPSRREFLKVMSAAAFFVGLGIPASVAAQLENDFGNKEVMPFSFEEGLRRLKDHAWDKKTESAWVYIEKDGKYGWIDIAVKSFSAAAGIDSAFLRSLHESANISKTYLAHTHPFDTYDKLLSKIAIEQAEKERKSPFPLPPSSADIILTAQYKHLLDEKELNSEKPQYCVVDPSGIWEYDVDATHHGLEFLFNPSDEGDGMPGFVLETSLQEWRARFVKDGGLNKENLEEFIQWAQDEYGVTLTYRPHD